MEEVMSSYLEPTYIIESDNPLVTALACEITASCKSSVEKAINIYHWVRDEIFYDPYSPFSRPEHYKASFIIKRKKGFCIPKAALLCALSRALFIPCRLGFADVKNHLATKQFIDRLGTDLVVYHGYAELYLNGKWVKVSPAFNKELCFRFGVEPLEFDGVNDALLQAYASPEGSVSKERRFMEYVNHHGIRTDVPLEEIIDAWKKTYGEERVLAWIQESESINV